MANTNAPFGFKPVRSATGGAHISVNYYSVTSSAARIGKGDLCVLSSSGGVARATGTASVGPWVGVAMIDGGAPVAGGISRFPVCDDQNAIFEAQGPTATLALTDMNLIKAVNCGTAPDSNTGVSKDVLTNTAATSANGVRLIRLADRPGNGFGAYQILEVSLNARNSQSAGV